MADSNERTPTGIPGLDEILNGGLIPNHSYLLVGSAGTGKTIASLQWLLSGHERGRKGLYITLAESVDNIGRNVESFGWNLDGLAIVDLNPVNVDGTEEVREYNVFSPSEVERAPLWEGIYDAIREHQPDLVVLDSVTQLRYLSTDDYQFRKQILGLVSFLYRQGCTSFLTYEPSVLEDEVSVALAVDGIIRLRMDVSPRRVIGLRSLQVDKLRGSDFMSGYHPLRFTEDGVRIFPRRVEEPGDVQPGQEQLKSGIQGLDELLGGGLESGTTTIISGPVGAGKTTLGVQFLSNAVRDGKRAALYTFEEAPVSVITRAEAIGISVRRLIEEEMLRIIRVNPMELYPDEFLGMLRTDVIDRGVEALMIDSLRGYDLAMEEFGSPIANIHNMVTFLNREQVTTLIVNEVEAITGDLIATDFSVSYVVDNVIILRYAEYQSRVIKVIACLKKRHGPMESGLREFRITEDGLEVSDTIKSLHGILSGAPTTNSQITSTEKNTG